MLQLVNSYRLRHLGGTDIMHLHGIVRRTAHWSKLLFVDEAHKNARDLNRKRCKVQGSTAARTKLTPHLGRSWTMVVSHCPLFVLYI
jgi:hypothetical protein